ncbi:MAG: dCTP deaminase [Deltaproteobacteria bacterium]|nr:dCTP deaminase [Deltaproteobacteria bacterium]
MSILTREVILSEIEAGRIVLDPFSPEMVGPASVDLHLGRTFRVFNAARRPVRIDGSSDYRDLSDKIELAEGETMLLMPGETILGLTVERVRLAPDLCGWLEGRSRFARVGLLVHISASFMQPGIDNHQVLEMSNFGPHPLELVPGIPICQFIFQRTEGQAVYQGRFAGQDRTLW